MAPERIELASRGDLSVWRWAEGDPGEIIVEHQGEGTYPLVLTTPEEARWLFAIAGPMVLLALCPPSQAEQRRSGSGPR